MSGGIQATTWTWQEQMQWSRMFTGRSAYDIRTTTTCMQSTLPRLPCNYRSVDSAVVNWSEFSTGRRDDGIQQLLNQRQTLSASQSPASFPRTAAASVAMTTAMRVTSHLYAAGQSFWQYISFNMTFRLQSNLPTISNFCKIDDLTFYKELPDIFVRQPYALL